MTDELTERQREFCRLYMDISSGCFGNATKAAILAGYAPAGARVRACRLLKKTKVEKEVERYRAQWRPPPKPRPVFLRFGMGKRINEIINERIREANKT